MSSKTKGGRKEVNTASKVRDHEKTLALFDIILQNIDYCIYVTDSTGEVIYENSLAGKLKTHYFQPQRKYLDREGKRINREDLPQNLALTDSKIHKAVLEIETGKKEPEVWFQIRAVPVFDDKENLVYVVNTWRDITAGILEERRRDHFIAIGSHELRTPLAGIKALNQVLSKFYYEQKYDKARSFFHKIDNKVNLLSKIIQDFIEVEKIRGGKLEFNPESFDFDELVDSAIQEMEAIHKSHKITRAGRANAKIIADRERIYQVLINLIANARKYSPEADKIEVEVSADSKKITAGIQDYGIGLSPEHKENIFEPFYRVKDPQMERVHGLGLGLYISYKIVELHGGRMWVKSKPGKGSTFYFSIPRIIKKSKKNYDF